ncbi:MAG: aspartate--tRNA ligase [Ardenticatenales bacterium]|nr:aspartate--tRNA ligase [Ardenticatenales bacterium]
MQTAYRTHTCGQLRREHVGQTVTLAGWVHRRREHGGLIFVDVRDRHGLTQVVCDQAAAPEAYARAAEIGSEWVVQVEGAVAARFEGNPDLATGEIEVRAAVVRVVNASKVPPFEVARDLNLDEAQRLRYRYLDLRRERMARNMDLRHRVTAFVRQALNEHGFIEIETPILTRSTPEGARDFLVPSRLNPGTFYALPQSPQQMKQLLMVAGMDRYYQVARCFRDEDLRADRQFEFTQVDIEMSFVDEDDVMALNEQMFIDLCRAVVPDRPIRQVPFPRMTYAEAMRRYGNDKPDLRFGMTMEDLGDLFATSDFAVFRSTVDSGGAIKAICVPRLFSRKEVGELEEIVKAFGAGGLAWVAFENGETRGSVAKWVADVEPALRERLGAADGHTVFIVAAARKVAEDSLGRLRLHLGEALGLIDPHELAFLWLIAPPLFEWNDDEQRWDSVHHPFTAPHPDDVSLLAGDPGAVRAMAYDAVLNGVEVAGGSIRIHDSAVQQHVFALLGIDEAQARTEFGHLLDAFQYGAPPHGGIAWGFDRTVMILAGESSIREVIAFPKTVAGTDPLTGAPAPVPSANLDLLGLKVAPRT